MSMFDFNGRLIDRDKQIIEIERADCEDSLYEFLRCAWRYMDPSPWKDGWPIEAICEHLQAVVDGEIRKIIINISPRSSKSSVCSVAFPAWTWAQSHISATSGPGVAFLHASYAEKLSLRDSVKCRRLIESPFYQERWGDRFALVSDQNTKSRFANDKGGERLITSIGAGVTGEGGSIIVIDDPNAANEAFSEATITATIDWWDQTMPTRLNDMETGAFIIIQQRLAENDLTGHILSREAGDWTHLMIPMRFEKNRSFMTPIGWQDPRTEEGELMWPERFSDAAVKSLERSMGKFIAAGQLQQRPEPPGGGIIKRDWWVTWEQPNFPLFDYIIGFVDTAYTEKTINDPSAMIVWGIWSDAGIARATRIIGQDGQLLFAERKFDEGAPKVMMMYAWAEHLEFHELAEKIHKTAVGCKIDVLLIENKAAGISVSQELQRLYANQGHKYGVRLEDPKSMDKMSRLYSVQHLFEEGIIWAPDKQWAENVIVQCGQFPRGKHDDLVDCVSGGLSWLRKTGIITRGREREQEIESVLRTTSKRFDPIYPV